MKRFSLGLLVAALALLLVPAGAQSPISEPTCIFTVHMTNLTASTQIITTDSVHAIRICHYSFSLAPNATTTAQMAWGTGTTCGTNTMSASPLLQVGGTPSNSVTALGGVGYGFIDENPTRGLSNYCLLVTGSSPAVNGVVRWGYY